VQSLILRSLIVLGKDAKQFFAETDSLPHVARAGDMLYVIGFLVGLILWGFAIVWFVVAVVMIATSGGFPFNMGWWGFIFPVGQLPLFLPKNRGAMLMNFASGVFTLLTITIGEELESRFFKVLSCVSDMLSHPDLALQRLLTPVSYGAGAHRSMRPNVAGCRCWDSAAVDHRQDVFRTLFRYGFVPEKKTWPKRGWVRGGKSSIKSRDVRCDTWLSQF